MTEASGISFRDAATVFVVRDVGESVAHYRDVLGFRVEFTYGEPAFYGCVATRGSFKYGRISASNR